MLLPHNSVLHIKVLFGIKNTLLRLDFFLGGGHCLRQTNCRLTNNALFGFIASKGMEVYLLDVKRLYVPACPVKLPREFAADLCLSFTSKGISQHEALPVASENKSDRFGSIFGQLRRFASRFVECVEDFRFIYFNLRWAYRI